MIENLIYTVVGAVVGVVAAWMGGRWDRRGENVQSCSRPTKGQKLLTTRQKKVQFENLMSFDGTERGQRELEDKDDTNGNMG